MAQEIIVAKGLGSEARPRETPNVNLLPQRRAQFEDS